MCPYDLWLRWINIYFISQHKNYAKPTQFQHALGILWTQYGMIWHFHVWQRDNNSNNNKPYMYHKGSITNWLLCRINIAYLENDQLLELTNLGPWSLPYDNAAAAKMSMLLWTGKFPYEVFSTENDKIIYPNKINQSTSERIIKVQTFTGTLGGLFSTMIAESWKFIVRQYEAADFYRLWQKFWKSKDQTITKKCHESNNDPKPDKRSLG